MRWLKDFGKTVAHFGIIVAALWSVATVLVVQSAKATTPQSSWLNAAQLESLRSILHTSGVTIWPNHAADPYTCDSNSPGGYYFNTATKAFRVCDETTWADGGGGVANLNDLGDVALTSPTNNQGIFFNSGTGDWENAAQGAAAINDHSDATITSPVSGHILEHNGTLWVNVAGSSPTTLDGLSDTTLTAPAEGDYLIRNGTDWKNVNPSGSFVFFPDIPVGNLTYSNNAVIAVDNDLRVFRFEWPYGCTVDRIVWAVDNTTGGDCDFGSVALFTLDGNTKIVDSGAEAYDTIDEIFNIDVTNTYIEQGTYWLSYTQDETVSCTARTVTPPTDGIPAVSTIVNTGSTMVGTAANPSVAGAQPTTLGTITLNNGLIHRPLVKFVCTDP